MRLKLFVLANFCLIDILVVVSALQEILPPATECGSFCEKTYSPHTYEENGEHEVCKRGCRMMTIIDFTSNTDDMSKALQECKKACSEAYLGSVNPNLPAVCKSGCDQQSSFLLAQDKSGGEEAQLMLVQPMFSAICDQMLQRMAQHMQMMMNLFDEAQLQGSEPQAIQVYRIQSYSSEDGVQVFRTYIGYPHQLEAARPQQAQAEERSKSSRCPLGSRARYLVLVVLLLTAAIPLMSCLFVEAKRPAHRPHEMEKKTPNADMDDDCLLLISNTDLVKLPLTSSGDLMVHGEPGPLPTKAKI